MLITSVNNTYSLDKLNNILNKARILVDKSEWKELEDFADNMTKDFLFFASKALSIESNSRCTLNSEDDRWEAYTTICGSHNFIRTCSGIEMVISLGLNSDENRHVIAFTRV